MKRYPIQVVMIALCAVLTSSALWAQVVTLVPAFVTQNDTVEVIFDATQGNAALTGVNQVYAHTGVITNLSPGPTSWRHVQGNWGTVDPKVQMTNLGNNLHSIKYHINSFYNVPANETVTDLAFVFRNADGSIVGRSASGADIFVPISQGGFQAVLQNPSSFDINSSNDSIDILAQSSANADLAIFLDNTMLVQAPDTNEIGFNLDLSQYAHDRYDIILRAVNQGNFYYDTVSFLSRSAGANISFDTVGYEEGLTVINDSTIALKLRAPLKEYVYVIGDFNDWKVSPEYEMYKNPDGQHFWTLITGLDPNTEYGFQYYVGEEAIVIADPYTEKILDPWNDLYIPNSVYPNLKPYPYDKTNYRLSTFIINKPQYSWQNDASFKRPDPEDLVIYELLIRDFGPFNTPQATHTYRYVMEQLDYLDSLGINAIQLMPVMEFEDNFSWGYDPNFFFAPDKIYGTAEDLKALVDSAHGRGMAVILDIAMNHAFGSSPMVRLYFDPSAGQYGQPTAQNPWFNQVAKHDFNVGYDFNHESDATKYFAKRVYQHWVKEYHIDGYRVDLSKGYTQKNTLGNIAALAQYDQKRINNLQRIKNNVNEIDSNIIMILEHFADDSEEIELSDRGFLIWGNENHEYAEATMGYSSNFSRVYYKNRNWNENLLVGYMESHDEERLMYKNLNFGGSSGNYNVKDLSTALDRVEMAAALFYTVPGPKMLWQFGERGYDYSINRCPDGTIDPNCRLAPKPSRWNDLQDQDRRDLFWQTANIINLRRACPNVFQTNNVNADLYNTVKSIVLQTNDSNAVIIGNFGLTENQVSEQFPHNGWWYDFNSGDSMMVAGNLDSSFAPGEYHIWLDFKMDRIYNNVDIPEWEVAGARFEIFPNPIAANSVLSWSGELNAPLDVRIFSADGRMIASNEYARKDLSGGNLVLEELVRGIPSGIYFLEIASARDNAAIQFIVP
jgi:1,4-alpha-glucan branching enzyme